MNNDQTRQRKTILVFGVVGIVLAFIIIGIVQLTSKSSLYVKDPRTGDELYKDNNQTPETATYKQFVSLLNAEELYKKLGITYFEQVRSDIETVVNKRDSSLREIYVDGSVGASESKVDFRVVSKDGHLQLNCSSTLLKNGVATTVCD